jgi:ligand-binding SRPBCC domain-containing protein
MLHRLTTDMVLRCNPDAVLRLIHEHTFEPWDSGTLARDYVRYAVPFDWLLHGWFVRLDIEGIFQFRAEALRKKPRRS